MTPEERIQLAIDRFAATDELALNDPDKWTDADALYREVCTLRGELNRDAATYRRHKRDEMVKTLMAAIPKLSPEEVVAVGFLSALVYSLEADNEMLMTRVLYAPPTYSQTEPKGEPGGER